MKFESTIGLEVHVELLTNTKMYCGCSTEFGAKPNSHVCPVCLGLPGTLPKLNKKAVEYAVKAGIALNCTINNHSRMDRKNYFYPDCPKNYQITQDKFPLCSDGYIEIENYDMKAKKIRIERIHIEEDAAKLFHTDSGTLVDYNRAGLPLIEIVSKPDIKTPKEATLYLQKLKSIIQCIGVSDCKMEQGSLRCDGNISIKKMENSKLGVKTEIKNVNSFKGLEKALEYEYKRQLKAIQSGKILKQETRRWDNTKSKTFVMRNKEHANDYRYFPEGDLVAINISDEEIERIRHTIPELPYNRAARFVNQMHISREDAYVLTLDMNIADFFENTVKLVERPKSAVNWIMGDMERLINENSSSIKELKFTSKQLAELIKLVDSGVISNNIGKIVVEEMFKTGEHPDAIIRKNKLDQNNSRDEIYGIVRRIIDENPKSLEDYKNGKKRATKFIIGLIMKDTKGKANPKIVNKLVNEEFNKR
ncbi:Asp-tRNA(Asn)/Glu-tRNA(Gln) amidotransferase subunit GatB [Clostridium tyrobutyricum]|uniref:Asp-tRNA(Asn)/Glu-tRNA(Gln) amidotransferase subunit GatB n=1 Tax=Clostridium tyrobutyricum TaxID=1519 RepID=UPI001C3843C8|nr:Asp-tRNA(Asn)/Glu-tRNA(Gln) amidotransferase subunit GatB [Clostridium tyrobutyricum]